MGNTLTPMAASPFDVEDFDLGDAVPLTRLRVITDRPFIKPAETWHKGAGSLLEMALVGYCEAQQTRLAG